MLLAKWVHAHTDRVHKAKKVTETTSKDERRMQRAI